MSIVALTKEDKTGDSPCVCDTTIDVQGINFVNDYNTNISNTFNITNEELNASQRYVFVTNLTQGDRLLTNATTTFYFRTIGNTVFVQGVFVNVTGVNATLTTDSSVVSNVSIPAALRPVDTNGQYTQSPATLIAYNTLAIGGTASAGYAKFRIGIDGKITIIPATTAQASFYTFVSWDSYSFSYQLRLYG
jgi:hypothetical protein